MEPIRETLRGEKHPLITVERGNDGIEICIDHEEFGWRNIHLTDEQAVIVSNALASLVMAPR